jgi:hypothetical protein
MEKKYELDKVLIDINSNSDNKDNSISTYICNYARILEAFIKDINDLKNNACSKKRIYGEMLEEFDIIDKFKKLVISEADRCIILNKPSSPISDNKNNKENVVKENTVSDNTMDQNKLDIDKFGEFTEKFNKVFNENKDNIYEEIENFIKQKVNEPIKPKTIKPKEDYNTINNKVTLSSAYGTCRNSDTSNNKENDPLDDFEFVAEAFSRLLSNFNKGDI